MTAPSEPVHVSALPIESTGGGADAATTGKPERRRVAGVVAVGLILASLYALAAQARYPGGGDAPYHILTARTWFSGGHFIPGDPTQTKFPPGWSLMLGAVGLLVGNGYAPLARFTASLFPLALFAAWIFIRRYAGQTRASWITLAVALSPACFDAATRGARSEALFMVASMAFLAWHAGNALNAQLSPRRIAIGSALLVATVMLRTIGVAMLVAASATVVHVALFERRRLRVVAVSMAAPLLASTAALGVWNLLARASPTELYPGERMNLYSSQFQLIDPHRPALGVARFADILERIPRNLRMLSAHAAELLTNIPWISPSWVSPVVIAILAVLLAGVIRELRRPLPLPAYYLLAYVAILSVWPFDEGQRFLVPIAPLLFLFAASGLGYLAHLVDMRGPLARRGCLAVALVEIAALVRHMTVSQAGLGRQAAFSLVAWSMLLAMAISGGADLKKAVGFVSHSRTIRMLCGSAFAALGAFGIYAIAVTSWTLDHGIGNGFQLTSKWIVEHTSPDAVVMAQRHLDFQMTTGRPGVVFPVTGDVTRLVTALARTRARYLVVYDTPIGLAYYFPVERDRFIRIQSALNGRLTLRAREQDVTVYEVPSLR